MNLYRPTPIHAARAVTGSPRTASVTAKTDCDIIEIDKSAMRDLLKQYPA